jgi:hypothetical protein
LIVKFKKNFPAVNIFQFLVIKTLDPDPYLALNSGSGSGSGSGLNESGSETLPATGGNVTPSHYIRSERTATNDKIGSILSPLS